VPLRLSGFLYKGALFAVVGFAAACTGTCLSYGLMGLRKAMGASSSDEPQTQRPSILQNSLAWSAFMFVSSNPRYQTLAGLERGLFKFAPTPIAKVGCGAFRTANNILGGATWVLFARLTGIQERQQ